MSDQSENEEAFTCGSTGGGNVWPFLLFPARSLPRNGKSKWRWYAVKG